MRISDWSSDVCSSDLAKFTATTTSAATRGNYSVEVVDLAKPEKLASAAYASTSAALGAGDVTMTVGGTSFTVTLGAADHSLSDLKNAINNASDNSGVTATLIPENRSEQRRGGKECVRTCQY